MASYATEVHRRQHRSAVFTAFIFQGWVRFIRWDRAGAIVSRAFNYHRDPIPFLKFFYLLAISNPGEQGYSTAFQRAGTGSAGFMSQIRTEVPRNKWHKSVCSGLGFDLKEEERNLKCPLYTVRPL